MSVRESQYDENIVRVFAFVAAGILLNFGLFFILSIFTPLVVGLVSGFFFFRYRVGSFVGTLSAAIAYSIVFVVTATVTFDAYAIALAVAIMMILGAFGGILGVLVHLRTSK
ncbi:MAG: hypothetical protein ACFFDV_05490 [Candidatus Thorarchaeota archaeon]